jgi:CBS domain containing-hemolysin-like protein
MIALLLALLCVLANAFFVAAEFALAKVRPTALEARARQGDASAARAHAITKHLDAYLSATQLGITLASLALGWIGEPAMEGLLSPLFSGLGVSEDTAHTASVAIGFSILSALHIVVGELVPKSLAIQKSETVAIHSARFLRVFFFVFYPALSVLNGLSSLVLRALRLPAPRHAEGAHSLEELRLVIDASLDEDDRKKRDLALRALRATDRSVRSAMVPRVEMQVLSLQSGRDAWIAKIRRFGFSRYPVSEDGNPDRIVGYVYAKDLLMAGPDRAAEGVAGFRRDIPFVPESASIGDVLEELQRANIPIAIVVDEYGGTSGLVTLEDLLVEVVGDVRDEVTGTFAHAVEHAPDGSLVAQGTTPIDEIELDGVGLPRVEGGETVSRYVLTMLGRLASPGDVVRVDGWEAIVEDVRARRVHRVRFRRDEREDDEPAGQPEPALGM